MPNVWILGPRLGEGSMCIYFQRKIPDWHIREVHGNCHVNKRGKLCARVNGTLYGANQAGVFWFFASDGSRRRQWSVRELHKVTVEHGRIIARGR